jgi:hypothetical protein
MERKSNLHGSFKGAVVLDLLPNRVIMSNTDHPHMSADDNYDRLLNTILSRCQK